jgi:flagellar motor switch protein FliN/FliY
MNISLGASATAVSTMLGTSTNITTPKVTVQSRKEFEFKDIEPAVGVEIQYVEGLSGKNVIMFSREDVRVIVGMMMGMEIPPEEFELDEMNQSAIREVMNQMMGSSATALSEFLGYTVNISTPVSFEIANEKAFIDKYFADDRQEVVVRFSLEIGDQLSSEFLNIMSLDLVKKLLEPYADTFSGTGDGSSVTAPGEREIPLEDELGGSLLAKLKGQSEQAVEDEPQRGIGPVGLAFLHGT